MNIPNLLTIIRFIIIPIFGYFLYFESYTIAVLLFLLGGLTDVLDGYIARRFNKITSWGKLADPAADKLMQITALVVLTVNKRIPFPILVVVAAKEILMGIGSIFLLKKEHHVVSSSWWGKLATVIFYLAVVLIIVFRMNEPASGIVAGLGILPTIFAFIMYIRTFSSIRKESRQ